MEPTLTQCRVALLVTDGFEQAELESPREALMAAGATAHVVSDQAGTVQGFLHTDKGRAVTVDRPLAECQASDYDALVLPGGVINGDALRTMPRAQDFVRQMYQAGKPIAAICHGAWILVSCDLVAGCTLTSWPSLKDDIQNAGGHWVDREVVIDGPFITSRQPDDLAAFNHALIQTLAQGPVHTPSSSVQQETGMFLGSSQA